MRAGVRWLATSLCLLTAAVMCRASSSANEMTKLYVTNSLGDDITVIDLTTFKVVDDIRVGEHVHGVCAQADGRKLFTTIESENNLKVIDTATDAVVDTISLTGKPNQCAATPDGRFVGVPIRNRDRVDIVDTTLRRVALPENRPLTGRYALFSAVEPGWISLKCGQF